MRICRVIGAVVLIVIAATTFGDDLNRGPSKEILFENEQPRYEQLRIRIRNAAGGAIEASADGGVSWRLLGKVVHPATKVNPQGYTASKWANDSSVAATAVNGIHIKVTTNPANNRGSIFSIIPGSETIGAASGHQSASIQTDMPGGTGIFGGYGPFVNSPVYIATPELCPLPSDYVPANGDTIVLIRTAPENWPLYCTFENKFGGRISVEYTDGEPRLIGEVLRPVVGIGRFEGTLYAAPGRLRANHCGVIDISTSPYGMVGGFQIVPREHAGSPEVSYISESTQWMVVGPPDVRDPSWEGVAPLFAGYLFPSYRPDDVTGGHVDWMSRTLSRTMIQVRYNNGPWQNMPRIALKPGAIEDNAIQSAHGRNSLWVIPSSLKPYSPLPSAAFTALRGVTHLRIVFPRAMYWPELPSIK